MYVKAGSQNQQGQACFSLSIGNYTSSWQYIDNGCYRLKWKKDGSQYKVEVWKIGSGPSCKDISHVEFYTGDGAPTSTPTPTNTPRPTVTLSPTPTPEPSFTPTPTEKPQCIKEGAECAINESGKECCAGLVCVPYNPNSGNGKCQVPDVTPTVTPTPVDEVTPTPTTPAGEPTATPKPEQPTSTPGPVSTRWSSLGYNATCENSDIEVTFDTKREDGSFEEKVKVTFQYQGTEKTAETNNNGRATVMYGKNGDGAVTAVADGYPSQSTHMSMPQGCPAVGGQVLGATTDRVLGATSYAATGNDAQSIFTVAQLVGMLLVATGTARYVKASLKA